MTLPLVAKPGIAVNLARYNTQDIMMHILDSLGALKHRIKDVATVDETYTLKAVFRGVVTSNTSTRK
jgi:hypothetical protein